MHYYMYEIKNNVNGKIYVGVHKTKVMNDGYMGSGKVIKAAIKKYGIDNFTKTILEIFTYQEEMFAREAEIVNEEFLARDDTYNLRRGGLGGFDYINSSGITKFTGSHSEETKQLIREKATGVRPTEETRQKLSDNNWAKKSPEEHRNHMRRIRPSNTESSNKKRSETLTGKSQKILVCHVCGKTGGNVLRRYHFENCANAGKVFTDTREFSKLE